MTPPVGGNRRIVSPLVATAEAFDDGASDPAGPGNGSPVWAESGKPAEGIFRGRPSGGRRAPAPTRSGAMRMGADA